MLYHCDCGKARIRVRGTIAGPGRLALASGPLRPHERARALSRRWAANWQWLTCLMLPGPGGRLPGTGRLAGGCSRVMTSLLFPKNVQKLFFGMIKHNKILLL